MKYLFFSLVFFFVWILMYIKNKQRRREMLTASLLLLPLVLFEPFFVPHYWSPDTVFDPRLSIEDVILAFSISGLASAFYEIVLGKHIHHYRLRHSLKGELFHGVILLVGIIIALACFFLLKMHFIYAAFCGMFVDICIMYSLRRDLLVKIVYSSILFGVFYCFTFTIFALILFQDFTAMWNIKNLSGHIFLGIPLEEIIWSFTAGALAGPLYEYLLSWKVVNRK